MTAKSTLKEPEVRGPKIFRKDKDLEYAIFLTYDKEEPHGPALYRRVLRQLIEQIMIVLNGFEMDTSQLSVDMNKIIEGIVTDPKMFDFS